jgi:predicted anti-sigma-YlaC factor YlaD
VKCREAGPLIADWVSGKLVPGVAPQMQEHIAACEACRAVATAETRMRDMIGSFRTEELDRDLAPDVLSRAVVPHRRTHFWTMKRAPAFAFAGVACAVIFLAFAFRTPLQPKMAVADEGRVVQMVADMQQVPDAPEEGLLSGGASHDPWLTSPSGGDN